MKLSLVVVQGTAKGKVIPINVPQFLIGRDPQCLLRPNSPLISKRHCVLFVREGKAFVRDFGSTNGTHVNGVRVEGEHELADADKLKVGPLQFEVRVAATSVDKPTPLPAQKPVATDDESIAEMLLDMKDEGDRIELNAAEEPSLGSTVLDVIPPQTAPAESPPADPKVDTVDPKATAAKKGGPDKSLSETQSAAAKILSMYNRRNRK